MSSEKLQDWIGFVNTSDYLSDGGFLSPMHTRIKREGRRERTKLYVPDKRAGSLI